MAMLLRYTCFVIIIIVILLMMFPTRHGTEANTMRGSDARTALHLAALHGRVSCCELLLAKGASVNRTDSTSEG